MSAEIVDRRASSLYEAAGFSPSEPPTLLDLVQRLVGPHSVSFAGRRSAPGKPLALVTRDGWRTFLSRGASDADNAFGLARSLAQWDVARGGPVHDVEALALAIAIPTELQSVLREHDWSHERIAREMHLPLAVVRARMGVRRRSARRLRAAAAVTDDATVAVE